jgi:hypothetical protein
MVAVYLALATWLREKGCLLASIPVGSAAGVDWVVDEIGGVAVTSDGCGILHGHSTKVMDQILAQNQVDLVIGDHGHAAAAINRDIPCIAIMDTNDPALAVAANLGAHNLLVLPLYDNRPNAQTRQLGIRLIELAEEEPTLGP